MITSDPTTGIELYVDGIRSSESTVFNNDGGMVGPVDGNLHLGESFIGVLDEAAIYTHSLGIDRVSAHYQAGVAAR